LIHWQAQEPLLLPLLLSCGCCCCQLLQVLLFLLQRHATCKGCQQAHVLLQGVTLRIVLRSSKCNNNTSK
jgi:hypothetical protein